MYFSPPNAKIPIEVIEMNCTNVGKLIRSLRLEKGMTQKELADKMSLSDKTVSKWERGLGCPDISFLAELSSLLEVNLSELLSGELSESQLVGGNMKKAKYYVCPVCGSISLCTGDASLSCCGRRLDALEPRKAEDCEKLSVAPVEDEWFIESTHPMEKSNYISFVAFATGDSVHIIKQYPEWGLSLRIPKLRHGTLVWYSTTLGLLYQLI